jgi:hypothetical protein
LYPKSAKGQTLALILAESYMIAPLDKAARRKDTEILKVQIRSQEESPLIHPA